MRKNKKVLILHENIGFGHTKIAEVICRDIKERFPDFNVLCTDVIGKDYPFIRFLIVKIYFFMINYVPFIWELLHEKNNSSYINRFFINIFISFMKRSYRDILIDYKPDVIISTYAFSAGVASKLKDEGFKYKLIGLITDFSVHDYWIYDNIDYYCVPNKIAYKQLSKSVRKNKIIITGIPVKKDFFNKKDKNQLKNKLGFKINTPLIVIMGGGGGIGKIEEINSIIDKININCQRAIITGTNIKLFNKLIKTKNNNFTKIYKFVDNIDEFMDACDLIIGKAGGSFLSECIAKKISPIIYGSLPAQERNNAEFIFKNKIGYYPKNNEELKELIIKLLKNKNYLNKYYKNIEKFSMDKASSKVLQLINNN